ncbi:MAG TPA: hypothetical protein VJR23_08900 [Candidatus Acidoferrales bacterium]|nr:hypothetical protein [Candidatus Acidoferrales bacterium]
MVLAMAALLFQAAAVTPAITASAPTNLAAPATRASAPAPVNTASLFAATPDEKPVVIPKPAAGDAKVVTPNAGTVKLNSSNSKPPGSYTLDSVALDSNQNSQAFSTIRIQDPKAPKQIGVITAESYPSRKAWWTLSIVQHSAAAFDAYSTRRAVSMGAVERDPMMRPFANSPGIYAAIQVGPLVFDYFSRKMQRSESPVIRRMWWLPQTGSTVASLVSGVHNMSVARQMK